MSARPLILSPALPSELLTHVLTYKSHPITLIICQPRASFLDSLLQCIPQPLPPPPPPAPPVNNDNSEMPLVPDYSRDSSPRHFLLIPTIHQVLTSRNIKLVFVPSLSHLRAYLAVYPPPTRADELPSTVYDGKEKRDRSLVVYGLVDIHRDTSEWSAQGLGHTLASLVEAGHRSGQSVVMIEEKKEGQEPDYFHGDEEVSEEEVRDARRREALKGWVEEIPILSGTVRKSAGVEGGWSGRMVEVGRILGRWFRFGRGEWNEGL